MTGQYGFHNGFLGMQDPAFKPLPNSPKAAIGNHFTHADLLKSKGYADGAGWEVAVVGCVTHTRARHWFR